MSGKLDQSLDTIVAARRKNSRPLRRSRRVGVGAKPTTAPIGGVKKSTKPAKKNDKVTVPAGNIKPESKIMVSNLPADVSEQQIKDYFQQTVAAVKKVLLVYGPNGQSRGIASVVFSNAASAVKAVTELNGVKVDGRPMKVEVIVDGKDAPAPPGAKKLADRITQPKSGANAKPKPATDSKAGSGRRARGTGRRGGRGGARTGNRTKKTAEELDAEMVDYFQAPEGGASATNGAAPATGDTNMDDDVL